MCHATLGATIIGTCDDFMVQVCFNMTGCAHKLEVWGHIKWSDHLTRPPVAATDNLTFVTNSTLVATVAASQKGFIKAKLLP